MELWSGSLDSFLADSEGGRLTIAIWDAFNRHHGHAPTQSEANSWSRSLGTLAKSIAPLQGKDIAVVCEYHLQFSKRRIDAVLLGRGEGSRDKAAIIELKQWTKAALIDDQSMNVLCGQNEELHPSEQALNYRNTLEDTHSAFVELDMVGASCAYCHDMAPRGAYGLRDPRFGDLLYRSPLYDRTEAETLCEFVDGHVGNGAGNLCMEAFRAGRFRPSPRLLDVLEETIKADRRWTLIDSQQIAYNAIWAQVQALLRVGVRDSAAPQRTPIILVRGGPGTGKTVIAVRLLRDALKHGLSAVHSTGGKAFTIGMRSAFDGAKELFVWNMSLRDAPYKGIDLLLVDEAHRLRKTSDTQFTPARERNRRSQFEELTNAARLTVFFLDDNQYVRPDEIGSTAAISKYAAESGMPAKKYNLTEQFRCGGCDEYVGWVDRLLNFTDQEVKPWGDSYGLRFVSSPEALEEGVRDAIESGQTARMVAGFCWRWSNPNDDGSLVNDVKIDNWHRPWNRKPKPGKNYSPASHPYTLWARASEGEGQVGCIYTAQGFEFDVVGVIWGNDLVWRNGEWLADKKASFDPPVKAKKADSLRLFRNAYRVLLTRGIKETIIFCIDEETREHLERSLP